jgi:hypothetical protein
MPYSSNILAVVNELRQVPKKIDAKVAKVVRNFIMRVDISVHEKTPVWSGLAVRNHIWTIGTPNTTEFEELKIGSVEGEGRRDANEAAARQSRDKVLNFKTPYAIFYLSNASKHIFDLEAGKLPSPDRSRVPPGGMFGLTYAEVRAEMGG